MSEKKYSKKHEWVELEGDVATVGITAHAAKQLGDIVFTERYPIKARKLKLVMKLQLLSLLKQQVMFILQLVEKLLRQIVQLFLTHH